MKPESGSPQIRAQRTTIATIQLLKRLGIGRDDPWVLLTTDGVISPEHARLRIDDGGDLREIPLPMKNLPRWRGYSFNAIGVPHGRTTYGSWQIWADLSLDIRYMYICYQASPLYVEYIASEREEPDAMIRGVFLPHTAPDRKMAWAARDLIFEQLQRGAPKGKRGPQDSERREWWSLAQDIGWEAARAKHKEAGGKYAEWKQIQRLK